jgi:phenylalanyl-tRNA synthetase alpha subunit
MFGNPFTSVLLSFTEPSAEIDIYWGLKAKTDYRITKGTGWLEIGGCGMVDLMFLKTCINLRASTTVLPLEWGRAHRYAIVPSGDIRMFMKTMFVSWSSSNL